PTLALVAICSLQWLVVNRQTDRGLARVRAFLMEPPPPTGLSATDRPYIWDFLATRALGVGLWDQCADAAAHAAQDVPSRRIFLMWQIAETMRGNDHGVERLSLELLRIDPNDPIGWVGLAGAAKRLGDSTQLARALAKLRTYSPEGNEMRVIRRHLTYYPQVWSDSLSWQ
ncbi:MAG TPA: hypothetical protein VKE94_14510, partial [Gemmataceae bacterium]|nr:hypothetical protein [Gemmataceae bacterium]